jgi:hypothetical protein
MAQTVDADTCKKRSGVFTSRKVDEKLL